MLNKRELVEKFTSLMPGYDLPSMDIYFTVFSMDGLQEMHRYSIKKEFYEFFEFDPFITIDDTEKYIEKLIDRTNSNVENGATTYWFVRRKNDGRFIGSAGLIGLNYNRQSVEWGYGIDPSLWGQGYILQIQEILKHFVFDTLELNRIYGTTMATNKRTIGSLKATGMKNEGLAREHYRKADEFIDGWRYGMTRSDHFSLCQKKSYVINVPALENSIFALMGEVFPNETITYLSSMNNTMSWDSLGHMDLMIALKEKLNVELSPADMAAATSVEAILKILALMKN